MSLKKKGRLKLRFVWIFLIIALAHPTDLGHNGDFKAELTMRLIHNTQNNRKGGKLPSHRIFSYPRREHNKKKEPIEIYNNQP